MNANRPFASLSLALSVFVAGCGNILSFSGPSEVTQRGPENATEYRCEGNRRFYVRTIDANSVWLIAPDRELRMTRSGSDGRYRAGRATLELNGPEARLEDPPTEYRDCKVPTPDAKK